MKGISEIITIVLIMFIAILLAGMAYAWFSGVFGDFKGGAESTADTAKNALGTDFQIVSARNVTANVIAVMIRNIGESPINASKLGAYLNGAMLRNDAPSYLLLRQGDAALINFSNANSPFGKRLTLVTDTGLEIGTTIT
jgi:archaellum component FlaF (FlaF/FlaG flagellin family)